MFSIFTIPRQGGIWEEELAANIWIVNVLCSYCWLRLFDLNVDPVPIFEKNWSVVQAFGHTACVFESDETKVELRSADGIVNSFVVDVSVYNLKS